MTRPITSTLDWCEENYVWHPLVAEFWNTVSSLAFVAMGLFGLCLSIGSARRFEPRFHAQYIAIMIIGTGSTLFHATLQHWSQQSDELSMLWGILAWFYLLYSGDWEHSKMWRKLAPVLLSVYMAAFSVAHWHMRWTTFFQVHFFCWVATCLFRLRKHIAECDNKTAARIGIMYQVSIFTGFAFWLIDFHFCEFMQSLPINPQGHALWHVIMGISSYLGPCFVMYVRAEQLGWHPRCRTWFGLPYITVHKGI